MEFHKTLAFYIRLSKEDLDLKSTSKVESNSVSTQRQLLQQYYNSNDKLHSYEVITFCDDGYSGTNFNRPRFNEMIEMVKRGQIHCIMVKDLSRFGRDFLEVSAYLELILPIFNVRFISVNDRFDSSEFKGTTGGLELALRNLINGLYSKDLSLKIRSVAATRAKRGDYLGCTGFYGYFPDSKNKRKIVVNSEVAHIIQRIYNECINGKTAAQIAKSLNSEGIPSPAAYKLSHGIHYNGKSNIIGASALWSASTVLNILNDERYTGKMISHKREILGVRGKTSRAVPRENWIIVEGTHEAIVSQEIFESAQRSRSKRLKGIYTNTAGYKSTNIFRCGYCGRKLTISHSRNSSYICLRAHYEENSPCASIHAPISDVKENTLTVLKALANTLLVNSGKELTRSQAHIKNGESDLAAIDRQISQLKNGRIDLYESYKTGAITRQQFLDTQNSRQLALDRLAAQKEALENSLAQETMQQTEIKEATKQAREISMLSEYNPEIISHFVKSIKVYKNDQIELELLINDQFIQDCLQSNPQQDEILC